MSFMFYQFIHILAVMALILTISVFIMDAKSSVSGFCRKKMMAIHGIALLVILVAGVGQMHKAGFDWELWTYGKLGIWLLLALTPLGIKKCPNMMRWFLMTFLLVGTAAYLALYKPF